MSILLIFLGLTFAPLYGTSDGVWMVLTAPYGGGSKILENLLTYYLNTPLNFYPNLGLAQLSPSLFQTINYD